MRPPSSSRIAPTVPSVTPVPRPPIARFSPLTATRESLGFTRYTAPTSAWARPARRVRASTTYPAASRPHAAYLRRLARHPEASTLTDRHDAIPVSSTAGAGSPPLEPIAPSGGADEAASGGLRRRRDETRRRICGAGCPSRSPARDPAQTRCARIAETRLFAGTPRIGSDGSRAPARGSSSRKSTRVLLDRSEALASRYAQQPTGGHCGRLFPFHYRTR
jgi:hypothetical protein